MDRTANLTSTPPTPSPETGDPEATNAGLQGDDGPRARIARGTHDQVANANAAVDLVEVATDLEAGPRGEVLAGLEHVARFGNNLFGEARYAESDAGHVVAALAETAVEAGGASAGGRALAAASTRLRVASAAVGFLDGVFDETDAPKVLTAFANGIQPSTVLTEAGSLAVDATVVAAQVVAGTDDALADMITIAAETRDGVYGPAVQGYAMLGGVLFDGDTIATEVGTAAAEQGEMGVFAAWGNAAGDLWGDVVHGESAEPRTVPVAEAERRERFGGALFGD